MQMTAVGLGLSFLLLSAVAHGQEPAKQIWQWTDEERLAARFNPESMRARVRDAKADGNLRGEEEERDVVWGTRNPELFMPFEVYRHLITTVFTSNLDARGVFRDGYLEDAAGLELGHDFWDRLEVAVRPDLQARAEVRALGRKLASTPESQKSSLTRVLVQTEILACSARQQGLEAARRAFGKEVFDHFLYVAVAPGMGLSSLDSQVSADHMRYLIAGCQ